MRLLFICLVLAVCAVSASPLRAARARRVVEFSGDSAVSAPVYVIDLDTAPEQRWLQVFDDYQDKLGPIMQFLNKTLPPNIQEFLDPVMAAFDQFLPGDIGRELKGISAYPGNPFSLGQLVILNMLYELTAYCTSIVAQAPDGTIFHSRHLDYDIEALRDLTIQVQFTQKQQVVYECATFVGMMGCFTGIRPNGWSVTVNERDEGTPAWQNLLAVLEGGQPVAMFLRNLLQSTPDYPTALNRMSTQILIAPVYLTVAGVSAGQGSIITRNRTVADDIWHLDAASGRWWILQTNDDHWKPPLDQRRDAANAAMKALGQSNVSNEGLFSALQTLPVFNSGTIYTSQMVPVVSNFTTLIRYDHPVSLPRDALYWW